jgi:hypothetical protein
MVRRSAFHETPGKQRWAERWLWRREHSIALFAAAVTAIGVIVAILSLLVRK